MFRVSQGALEVDNLSSKGKSANEQTSQQNTTHKNEAISSGSSQTEIA